MSLLVSRSQLLAEAVGANASVDPVGQGNIPLVNIIASPVRPDWFTGYTSHWNSDATTAVQAAIQYASDQNRTLQLVTTATCDTLYLLPRSRIEGKGMRADYDASGSGAGLRLKQNAAGTALLTLNDQNNDSIWNDAGVEIYDLFVYGDRDNQTGSPKGVVIDHSGTNTLSGSFKPRHKVRGLQAVYFKGHNIEFGAYTRDSYFDDLVSYGSYGNGVYDHSVDNDGNNWNIGQSLSDGWYCTASAFRRTNIKSWGSGQYSSAGDTTGFDGQPAANVVLFKTLGADIATIYSQESRGHGIRLEGQGSNEIVGLKALGLYSDGDNGAGGTYAGLHMFRVRKSEVSIFVGKQNAGLAGTPYNAVNIATSSGNTIRLNSSGLTSWAFSINASDAYDNTFQNNAMLGGGAVQTAVSSYTPNPYDYQSHEVTHTTATTLNVVNPGKKERGFELRFLFIQSATGGAALTFDTDFVVPAGWSYVTTANATNYIAFRSNGTSWLCTGYRNG